MAAQLKELLEYLARALVDQPDAVVVTELGDDVLELKVADDDRGKVIGRKGRTAHAIRALLAAAVREGEPPQLEIVD